MIASPLIGASRLLSGTNSKADLNKSLWSVSHSSYHAISSFIPPPKHVLFSSNTDSLVSTIAGNPLLIGTLWFLTSSIFSTYTTMRFLRHGKSVNHKMKKSNDGTDCHRNSSFRIRNTTKQHCKAIMSMYGGSTQTMTLVWPKETAAVRELRESILDKIPAANLLTMYRFAGSLLVGLFFFSTHYPHSLMSLLIQRWNTTMHYATNDFMLPAIFLFLANFLNA
jgi:hypothetical protein